MNRLELQTLADERILDANALLAAKRFDAAYYLCGYAVECALKAAIAKRTQQFDFPDKSLAIKAWIHELSDLLKLSQIAPPPFGSALELNWRTACKWNEGERYRVGKSKKDADDLLDAVRGSHGVLPWLKVHW